LLYPDIQYLLTEFILEPKEDTLAIECRDGSISMKGNSILAYPRKFFQLVTDWVSEYVKEPAVQTDVILKFEYIDTASVQSIFDILKLLKHIPDYEKSVLVNWYFEFDDPELLEVGEIMEARLKLKFNYVEYKRKE
jgi:hypothetical protein